jgi:hypothetical protein
LKLSAIRDALAEAVDAYGDLEVLESRPFGDPRPVDRVSILRAVFDPDGDRPKVSESHVTICLLWKPITPKESRS